MFAAPGRPSSRNHRQNSDGGSPCRINGQRPTGHICATSGSRAAGRGARSWAAALSTSAQHRRDASGSARCVSAVQPRDPGAGQIRGLGQSTLRTQLPPQVSPADSLWRLRRSRGRTAVRPGDFFGGAAARDGSANSAWIQRGQPPCLPPPSYRAQNGGPTDASEAGPKVPAGAGPAAPAPKRRRRRTRPSR